MTAETEIPLDQLIGSWWTFPDAAEHLDIPVTRVHNMVRDGRLLAARIGERQIRSIPAELFTQNGFVESLHGTATVLADAGFDDESALRWLFTADDSLPGRPIDALREGRKTEVRRRAQVMA